MKQRGKSCPGYLVLALLMFILIVSCAAPAITTIAPTATASATPTATGPKSGGTLRVALNEASAGLDPVIMGGTGLGLKAVVSAYSEIVMSPIGRNFLDLKQDGRIAESWEVSPDGLKMTFKIRKGVKFQNIPPVNGREMTSADVRYNYERIKDPKTRSPQAATLRDYLSFETPDPYTFIINFSQPMPGHCANMSGPVLSTFAREVIEQDGSVNKTWIGTGPFILKEYTAGSRAILEKNPDYWAKGMPYLDRVELLVVPEEAQRKAAFRAGQIDVSYENKSFVDDVSNIPGIKIVEATSYSGAAIYPSVKQKPEIWGNKKVRQAMQYAIDYDGLLKAVLNGAGSRTDVLAPWYKDWGAITDPTKLPQRDVAKAKALLAEAGFPNGIKTTILQDTGRMRDWGAPVEAVQAMLKDIGIDATIVPMDSATFTTTTRAGDFELAVTNCPVGQAFDPDTTMKVVWSDVAATYSNKLKMPKVEDMINEQSKLYPNNDARKKIIGDIMTILRDEVALVPLYVNYNYQVVQPWVEFPYGGDPNGQYGAHNYRSVWIDKK